MYQFVNNNKYLIVRKEQPLPRVYRKCSYCSIYKINIPQPKSTLTSIALCLTRHVRHYEQLNSITALLYLHLYMQPIYRVTASSVFLPLVFCTVSQCWQLLRRTTCHQRTVTSKHSLSDALKRQRVLYSFGGRHVSLCGMQ